MMFTYVNKSDTVLHVYTRMPVFIMIVHIQIYRFIIWLYLTPNLLFLSFKKELKQ